jgi:hypothetical protein
MRARRCGAAAALLAAFGVSAAPVSAAPAPGCAAAKGVYRQSTPWPQRLIGPERIWPLTDGTGQTVAVVGTGIDARNTQFRPGQILPGVDVMRSASATADSDCDGRGTFAAGIVGARPDPSTTFAGLAPGVRLLPIRYTQSTGDSSQAGDPKLLATAIRAATAARVGVILVVVPAASDGPELRDAVADARRAGAVVVSPAAAGDAGAHSYPTADPGVLGVGAVDEQGHALQAESGDDIAVAAPGAGLVSTAPGRFGHVWGVKDPEFAAAYVAATAALLRAERPGLSPDQIVSRLTLTADRPPTGGHDPRVGWGVVDPYAALTAVLPPDVSGPSRAAAPAGSPRRIAPAAAPSPTRPPDRWPGIVAVLGIVIAATIGFAASAVRRGRARRWRPGRLAEPDHDVSGTTRA